MRAVLVFVVVGLVLFLGTYISTHNIAVFNPKGIIALAEKNLIITALCLMLIVIIPVFVLLAVFAWRYREGNTSAKYTPDWQNNRILEIIWWTIPTIIIIILAGVTWTSTHELDPFKPLDSNVKPITIEVVALDWKWLFIYPDENIATVNFVEFPKDVPINFRITSDSPMNSFWIPQLGGQIYSMPGMSTQLHLMATENGDYNGLSSNFSGAGFSGMKFVARVTSQADFDQWVKTVKATPLSLTKSEYDVLSKQSENNPVQYYASVEQNLYNTVIIKFMAPMNENGNSAGMESINPQSMEGMSVN